MMFSVIIPTYNRLEFLTRTMATLWAQRFADFEVIVTDDGSTDGTVDFLHAQEPRAQVFHEANKGPGAARNLAAEHASGDYLAFLDSDDIWFPWTLATFAHLIRQHHAPAILSGHLLEFVDDAEVSDVQETPTKAEVFPDYLASSRHGYFVGACMAVIRRDEFMRAGGFTERRINCEDHDLILRMGTAPGFAQVLGPVTLGWRRHPGSATTDQARSAAGGLFLIEQERGGMYPGGRPRAVDRRRLVTLHVRPVSLACLQEGLWSESWRLYRAAFAWHFLLGRWKYLFGFPLKATLA